MKKNMLSLRQRLSRWAGSVKRDIHAVYLTAHDPRVPWYAKALAAVVAAYALSPVDLIPDFVPVLGYLDDLLLLPLGILLVIRLTPPGIMAEHRAAAGRAKHLPMNRIAAAAVIVLWLLGLILIARWAAPLIS
jgi:uncharacterized membrane protein YkvA (DUF1232 family)